MGSTPIARSIEEVQCYTWNMNKFNFKVVLDVEVEAYDAADAHDLLEDTFGLGEDCGINIRQAEFSEQD